MLSTIEPTMPRFMVTLEAPAADAADRARIPLAITGAWVRGSQKFSITRQDLESIARNFKQRQNGEINVDYDHASEMPEVAAGGPIPSAGRIVAVDPPEPLSPTPRPSPTEEGNKGRRYILWGWYEPTERARELIGRREYRYISPAIDWGARSKRSGQRQGATLTSVALTNRPFIEELPPIRLSDPAYRLIDVNDVHVETSLDNAVVEPDAQPAPSQIADLKSQISNLRSQPGGSMKKVQLSVADGNIKITHPDLEDQYYADPQELRQVLEQLGLPAEPQEAALREIPLAQAAAVLSEADAKGKAVPAVEFFQARVEQALNDAVQAGKILPRQRNDWRRIALADFPTFSKLMSEQAARLPLQPLGFSSSAPADAATQVKFLAEQRMRERGVSYGQALSEIGREQPDLAQQYRRAVSGNYS